MNKTLLAALSSSERLLVAETEPANLRLLDEDATSALHTRVLRARNKAQGIYRRGASSRVAAKGGRGKAYGANANARLKVEAFEEALGRVSARLATLAKQSARELRDERLAAAAAAKRGGTSAGAKSSLGSSKTQAATKGASKRRLRTAASEKKRAGNRGANARWQGKRDGR